MLPHATMEVDADHRAELYHKLLLLLVAFYNDKGRYERIGGPPYKRGVKNK